jgi:hypothetical protein
MTEGSPIRRMIATGLVLVPLLGIGACKENPEPTEKPGITSGDVFKKAVINEHRFFTSTPHVTKHEIYIADCPARVLPPYERGVTQECKTNAFLVPEQVFKEVDLGETVQAKENWIEVKPEIRR